MNLLRWLQKWLISGEQGIFYIGGSDVLPPPLRGEEEKRAIEALSRGEETAKQTLVEHNLRLVVYIARRFDGDRTNLEDLISIGTIGLIKAVNTYASRCIENEILMHLRKIANQKAEVSLDEPINLDGEGNELLLSDILGTAEDDIQRPLEADAEVMVLRQALTELPQREQEIVSMRFGLDGRKELTQKEVAQKIFPDWKSGSWANSERSFFGRQAAPDLLQSAYRCIKKSYKRKACKKRGPVV